MPPVGCGISKGRPTGQPQGFLSVQSSSSESKHQPPCPRLAPFSEGKKKHSSQFSTCPWKFRGKQPRACCRLGRTLPSPSQGGCWGGSHHQHLELHPTAPTAGPQEAGWDNPNPNPQPEKQRVGPKGSGWQRQPCGSFRHCWCFSESLCQFFFFFSPSKPREIAAVRGSG